MELFLLYLWLKLDAMGVTLILIIVVVVLFYGSLWFYRIVENYGAYDVDKLRRYNIKQQSPDKHPLLLGGGFGSPFLAGRC